jgi:hypothetical protein
MMNMSTTDLVLIIGVVTTNIIAIITALKSEKRGQTLNAISIKQDDAVQTAHVAVEKAREVAATVAQTAATADVKLNHITDLTNSRLTAALKEVSDLKTLVSQLVEANARQPSTPTVPPTQVEVPNTPLHVVTDKKK